MGKQFRFGLFTYRNTSDQAPTGFPRLSNEISGDRLPGVIGKFSSRWSYYKVRASYLAAVIEEDRAQVTAVLISVHYNQVLLHLASM